MAGAGASASDPFVGVGQPRTYQSRITRKYYPRPLGSGCMMRGQFSPRTMSDPTITDAMADATITDAPAPALSEDERRAQIMAKLAAARAAKAEEDKAAADQAAQKANKFGVRRSSPRHATAPAPAPAPVRDPARWRVPSHAPRELRGPCVGACIWRVYPATKLTIRWRCAPPGSGIGAVACARARARARAAAQRHHMRRLPREADHRLPVRPKHVQLRPMRLRLGRGSRRPPCPGALHAAAGALPRWCWLAAPLHRTRTIHRGRLAG